MPSTIRRAINEGDRQLRRAASRYGEDFRLLRLRHGVTQAAVARAIGVHRSVICRMEAGSRAVSSRVRARAAAVLGADFRIALYADAAPLIHDAAQAGIVETLLRLRGEGWRERVEALVPGPGRRSTDLRLDGQDDTVLIEVETHVSALEAIIREGHDKRAAVAAAEPAGRRVHFVLVLPPTRHHRALVANHPETMRSVFPCSSASLRRALTSSDGRWPGDGILWLGAGRQALGAPPERVARAAADGPAARAPRSLDRA